MSYKWQCHWQVTNLAAQTRCLPGCLPAHMPAGLKEAQQVVLSALARIIGGEFNPPAHSTKVQPPFEAGSLKGQPGAAGGVALPGMLGMGEEDEEVGALRKARRRLQVRVRGGRGGGRREFFVPSFCFVQGLCCAQLRAPPCLPYAPTSQQQ